MFLFSIFFSPEFDYMKTSFSAGCLLSIKLGHNLTSEFAWLTQFYSRWVRSYQNTFFSSSPFESSSTRSSKSLKTSYSISSTHHFHLLKSNDALVFNRWIAQPFFLSVVKQLTRFKSDSFELIKHIISYSDHLISLIFFIRDSSFLSFLDHLLYEFWMKRGKDSQKNSLEGMYLSS